MYLDERQVQRNKYRLKRVILRRSDPIRLYRFSEINVGVEMLHHSMSYTSTECGRRLTRNVSKTINH